MKKLKNVGAGPVSAQKGITLIALVITIIVMLILVAVTISMAVNGGLFDYAEKAVGETQNAINDEQALADAKIKIGDVWYNSIDEYIDTETITETHNWARSGDTFTCSHCNTTYTMGDVVNYTANGKTSTTITAQMSGLDKYYAQISAYPSSANVDENGAQTIEAQDATWIVLGMEDTNGNGTNETLLITTQAPVYVTGTKSLYFYGAAAYNNGEDEIDRICEELYSNSSYGTARGMTLDDVNAALNYTPTTAYYYDGSDYIATGNFTTKLKDLDIFEAMVESGTYTPDGANTEAALGEYVLNGYRYYITGTDSLTLENSWTGEELKTITEVERDTIFGASRNYYHWLSTPTVNATVYGSTYAYFGLACVSGDGVVANGDRFYSDAGSENHGSRSLRPVVSLTSNLPASAD